MNTRLCGFIIGFIFLAIPSWKQAGAEIRDEFQEKIVFEDQQHPVYVAIASNNAQREQGLMFRKTLGADQGMLFVYPDQARRGMWMKNTLLALDVLFLSGDGRIVGILKNLPPCIADPCRIYDSKMPARYMLELSGGFTDKHSVEIGQKISLP